MPIGKKSGHLLTLPLLLWLTGCSTLAYYDQAMRGQAYLLSQRHPVEEVVENPDTKPELREKLLLAQKLYRFAVENLHLPATDSYQYYADLQRPYSVWVVFAAPWNDLTPKNWCYPVVGCLSYRGFFRQSDALIAAQQVEDAGMDIHVQGVSAYSTLGWFADPLLNTFIHWPTPSLAHLLFHEMAHERLYIQDDTDFNESYAEAVAEVGVQRFLASQSSCPDEARRYQNARQARDAFLRLLPPVRQQLQELYQTPLTDEEKQHHKKEIIQTFIETYHREKSRWDVGGYYEKWFSSGVNNAKLASVHTYHRWVAAFRNLLHQVDGDLEAFHQQAANLATLPAHQRHARLLELSP